MKWSVEEVAAVAAEWLCNQFFFPRWSHPANIIVDDHQGHHLVQPVLLSQEGGVLNSRPRHQVGQSLANPGLHLWGRG